MSAPENKVCTKCKKPMGTAQNYYKSKRLDRYPDEYLDECKKCFTMHINIREPASFLPMLEEIDIPYIESEWDTLVERYGQDTSTTSTAIFGRYVAKMKLRQYSKYGYDDTETFVEEAKMRDLRDRADKLAQINKYRDALDSGEAVENMENLDLSVLSEEEVEELLMKPDEMFEFDPGLEAEQALTEDDKKYLKRKWGKTYTIIECITLEKLFLEMMNSYDIRTASHKDYLLKICRLSLKMDQALETNDIEGYQKMSRIYDLLMKSAKFTAAQNKDTDDSHMDAVGVIVGQIEKEKGFIPKYHSERQDVVDATLDDMNGYLRNLVMSELNLGNMIEVYLQKMKMEDEKEEDVMEEDDEIIILGDGDDALLEDEDFVEYSEMINKGQMEDDGVDLDEEFEEELEEELGDILDE